QAEDGIRDKLVTGVQTCALPIFGGKLAARGADFEPGEIGGIADRPVARRDVMEAVQPAMPESVETGGLEFAADHIAERAVERRRSEERRVGKQWRCPTCPAHGQC